MCEEKADEIFPWNQIGTPRFAELGLFSTTAGL